MAEENKDKVIFIKKSRLALLVVGIIIIAILIVGWRFLFPANTDNNIEHIAADSPVLGNSTLYLIEFSDYECPYCQASEGTNQEVIDLLKQRDPSWEAPIPKVIEEYVNTGLVSLVFRNYPVHQNKEPVLAVKCAKEQGKFWEYHTLLFENYDSLLNADLKRYASDTNLDLNQFTQCLDSKKYQSSMDNDLSDGSGLGVSGTPTFFIGNDEIGYEKLVGAQSFAAFKQIIDSKISV